MCMCVKVSLEYNTDCMLLADNQAKTYAKCNGISGDVRYVGVIWFVCHVLQLLLIRFHNETRHISKSNATSAKSRLKIGPLQLCSLLSVE